MKILVTGVSGGTGKSTVAHTIAYIIHASLIVDMSINRLLDVIYRINPSRLGLTTFQTGVVSLDELVVSYDGGFDYLCRGDGDIFINSIPSVTESTLKVSDSKTDSIDPRMLFSDCGNLIDQSYNTLICDYQITSVDEFCKMVHLSDKVILVIRADVSQYSDRIFLFKMMDMYESSYGESCISKILVLLRRDTKLDKDSDIVFSVSDIKKSFGDVLFESYISSRSMKDIFWSAGKPTDQKLERIILRFIESTD